MVTIVVPLAVVYGWESDGPPPAEVVTFVQEGFAAGAAYWNAGFARLAACFELRLQVDVAFTTIEGQSAPEQDRFHTVYPYSQWRSGTFPDGRGLPTVTFPGLRSGDLAGDADITHPFDQFTVGYLPEWLFEDPWAMAHEFGHFFGLGDDYRDGGIIPGREGTLMGGTEGADYIDQALVNDVTKLIEEAGYDLPDCITGKVLFTLVNDTVSEFQITHAALSYEVIISLKPKENGMVEGLGVVTHHFETTDVTIGRCESAYVPIDLTWQVKITGRFVGEVLSFEFDPPSKGYTIFVTGSCGTDSFPYEVYLLGGGWQDITFTDGLYEYVSDTAESGGTTHLEVKLKQAPPD